MIYVLTFIHVVVSIFLILVVLLQQGKGADLSVFGGGSTQAAFGARGAATLLHKLTVAGFVLFTLTTMSIALMKGGTGSSVMSGVPAASTPAPADTGAASATTPSAPAPANGTAPAPVAADQAPAPSPAPAESPATGGTAPQQ